MAADTRRMASQISAPVRIVALVGLLGALAMGAWMMLGAGATGAGPADSALAAPLAAEAQAKATAAKLNAHNVKTAAGQPKATPTAKPKAATKPKTAATPKPAAAAAKPAAATARKRAAMKLPAGTPTTIASVLATHQVVVVLLYNPQAKVDSYSLGEAVLGAQQAGAGFLRVNVLDQAQALPFSTAYGVLQDPTLLFFARPGTLIQKLEGFADHQTVAQAAANAALGIGSVS